jgi:hypothetical protein
MYSVYSGERPQLEACRHTSPLCLAIPAISASHSRAADSTRVSSTDCRSNVDRLMTFRTSAVAVFCWSDSRSSFSNLVFSMAMTAWAAKFLTNSICLSLNGRTSWR